MLDKKFNYVKIKSIPQNGLDPTCCTAALGLCCCEEYRRNMTINKKNYLSPN